MSDFVRKPLEVRLNKKNFISRIERLERGTGARPTAIVDNLQEISLAMFDGGAIDPSGNGYVAGPYPLTPVQTWRTDDTGATVARLLGYYLSDNSYSGLEIDVIAKPGSVGDLVLACFLDTDNVDVDPARAAIHLRSDGTIVVTQGRFVVNGLINFDNSTATIAGGVITATRSFMTIDTQGGAATDDLDTINGGSEGDILVLSTTSSTRDITLRDLTGNLQLAGDFLMDTAADTIALIKSSGNWRELSRSNNA